MVGVVVVEAGVVTVVGAGVVALVVVVAVVVVLARVVTVVVVLAGVVTVVAAGFDPALSWRPRRPTVRVTDRGFIANAERPTPALCETSARPPDPAARARAGANVPVIMPAEASAANRRRLVTAIRGSLRRRFSSLASARAARGVTSRSQGAGRSVPTRRLR